MRQVLVFLGTVVLFVAPAGGDDKEKSDKDKLQGDWTLVSSETGDLGKKDEKEVKRRKLVVKDDGWQHFQDDKAPAVAITFKLDPAKSPKEVDFEAKAPAAPKAVQTKGIYKLEGDTLTVCRTFAVNVARPTEFKATKGVVLEVYKRAEKK